MAAKRSERNSSGPENTKEECCEGVPEGAHGGAVAKAATPPQRSRSSRSAALGAEPARRGARLRPAAEKSKPPRARPRPAVARAGTATEGNGGRSMPAGAGPARAKTRAASPSRSTSPTARSEGEAPKRRRDDLRAGNLSPPPAPPNVSRARSQSLASDWGQMMMSKISSGLARDIARAESDHSSSSGV